MKENKDCQLPLFDEIQKKQLPSGTCSAFISNHGIYYNYCKTAIVTLAFWEYFDDKQITRIHRFKSLGKYKVFADELKWQLSILERVVDKINKTKVIKDLPIYITSRSGYYELEQWLETVE